MKTQSLALCLVAAAALVYGFQSPVSTTAKGSIEGQVVNAKTGAPLKRATVRVMGMAAPAVPSAALAAALPNRALTINKETDEQGRFTITGLDPGKYRISVERQGFLRLHYGARRLSGGSTPVVVGDGQSVKGIDFKMMPQGVIAGRVLDEDGEPMANVQVRAQRSFMRNGKRQWNTAANASTSDIGEFRLPELHPGRYVVVASPRMNQGIANTPGTEPLPATAELTYAATFYPSTADSAAAMPVDVGEGSEVRNIDIRLAKARVFRVRGRLTGMVSNASGGRLVVPVMLSPRDGSPGQSQISMAQARGPEWTFEVRNVPPGQYLAHAQANAGGQQYAAVAPVDVTGGHVEGLVLAFSAGGDVQGSVKVTDAANPVEMKNLQVFLRTIGFGGQSPRARVGEDMKFTLKGVPPVNYAVSVSGYPDSCYVKSIRYGGAEVTDEGVQMTSGGALEITISASAGQIDMVVMTKDDKPAAGAQVMVMREGSPWQSRSADENGMLSVKGLKPGDYKVVAWEDADPQQLFDTDYLRKFESDFKAVKIGASGHEAVQLKAIPAEGN